MSEKGTVSNRVKHLVDKLQDFLKPCETNLEELVVAGFGSVLEVYDCTNGQWLEILCGQDIQVPKVVVGMLDTTGAGNKTINPTDGLIYDTMQAGKRAKLEPVTYTGKYTKKRYSLLESIFAKTATYRIVATDIERTFWAFNAIYNEKMVNLPSAEDATGDVEFTITPTGFMVWDRLNPVEES